MAKKGKAASGADAAHAGDSGDQKPGKKAKKAKRRLGPGTVARPCLFGAAILTLLGATLPR